MKFLVLFIILFVASCGKEEGPVPAAKIIERAKDPVCGMWVEVKDTAPRYLHDNAWYYFCCAECGATFITTPAKYAKLCRCKSFDANCKCGHCQGKLVPCDCE